jgi:hypothetical protein
MAVVSDITTSYTLTSSGGSIVLNNGTLGDGTDKYWLTEGHNVLLLTML